VVLLFVFACYIVDAATARTLPCLSSPDFANASLYSPSVFEFVVRDCVDPQVSFRINTKTPFIPVRHYTFINSTIKKLTLRDSPDLSILLLRFEITASNCSWRTKAGLVTAFSVVANVTLNNTASRDNNSTKGGALSGRTTQRFFQSELTSC
jgi:hypothetical protein